jgi:hypothetical protein
MAVSGGDKVVREFALHADLGASIVVARIGEAKTLTLPKRSIEWRRLAGRVAEGPRGRKLAVVEAEMPAWLAKDRGLR